MPAASLAPTNLPLHVTATHDWTGEEVAVNSRVDFGRTLPTSLTSAKPCRAADLELHPRSGPGLGTVYASLSVRNSTTTPCLLSGYPRLALLDRHGVTWHSSGTRVLSGGDPTGPMVLLPESWAVAGPFALGSSCGGYGQTVTLRVTMPQAGGTATVPWNVGTDGPDRCVDDGPHPNPAPNPGDFNLVGFRSSDPMSVGEGPMERDRRIQLLAPPTARRGSLLKYVVRFSARPVTGAGMWESPDCPLFQQTLVRTGPTYELNCPEGEFLEPGQAIDYDMQVAVPKDAPLGPTTLSWQLVEPAQEAVTTTVSIVD